MKTKDSVLEILKSSGSKFVSGQQMAEELYVSRAAIWKAIRALENDAMVGVANGTAAKIIVPTDVVETTKKNVIFAETTGLGDITGESVRLDPPAPKDECCEGKSQHKPFDTDDLNA